MIRSFNWARRTIRVEVKEGFLEGVSERSPCRVCTNGSSAQESNDTGDEEDDVRALAQVGEKRTSSESSRKNAKARNPGGNGQRQLEAPVVG
jgi:hypothetical protein